MPEAAARDDARSVLRRFEYDIGREGDAEISFRRELCKGFARRIQPPQQHRPSIRNSNTDRTFRFLDGTDRRGQYRSVCHPPPSISSIRNRGVYSMRGALDGLKVIDFGQYIAAPLAAMILSDNAADVIRIDPPGGPRWNSSANAVLQRGKRSIVLDLKDSADRQVALDLIARADVVLEGFRPGVMARLGLGPNEMVAANPQLVYCSIPGFGHDDPRAALRGWEGIVGAAAALYAKAGNDLIASSGGGGAFPVFNPLPLASNYAAVIAATSIVAALLARTKCGKGQKIEVPLFDAIFDGFGVLAQKLPPQVPNLVVHGALDGVYESADGKMIYICMPTPEFWERLSKTFMDTDWFAQRLNDTQLLAQHPEKAQEAVRRLRDMFRTRTAHEWDVLFNAAPLNCTICKTTSEWLRDPQSTASGTVIELEDLELGPTRQFGYTHHLSKTPPSAQFSRPLLNADAASIREGLAKALPTARPRGSIPEAVLTAPLQGMKVIDTSHYLAGPTCGRILGEYGAEVVKIDSPTRPVVGFIHLNSGKSSALIDVRTMDGREVLNRHVVNADVFIQSFSPGTVEHLGIDEASIRKINPEIVYTSVNCYGHAGPRAGFHGVEAVGQAISGMAWRWGGTLPKMQRLLVCDYGAGHLSALGTMIALYHRAVTGTGQLVHSSLVQAATFHQAAFAIDYSGRVWNEPSGPRASGWGPLDRLYEASDGWFYVVVPDNRRYALDGVAGLQAVAGLEGETLATALAHRFATENLKTWCSRLDAAGICAHPVEDFQTLLNSKLVRDRGLIVSRQHKGVGEVRNTGAVPKLSFTPVRTAAPVAVPPGSDTAEVVSKAGLGDRLPQMIRSGAVAEQPVKGTFVWL
jgi:crotonobetainyl-CoA:carnitine CoA-transferase CaiB-like acyl-CoA transferase